MESDSIEAAVLDIEELIVRIEWLKRKLNPDVGEGNCWKYEDYLASSTLMNATGRYVQISKLPLFAIIWFYT